MWLILECVWFDFSSNWIVPSLFWPPISVGLMQGSLLPLHPHSSFWPSHAGLVSISGVHQTLSFLFVLVWSFLSGALACSLHTAFPLWSLCVTCWGRCFGASLSQALSWERWGGFLFFSLFFLFLAAYTPGSWGVSVPFLLVPSNHGCAQTVSDVTF